jgi:AmmeMemoRadiSam system protein B
MNSKTNIREPVVQGLFYPASKDSLLKMISKMINFADSVLRDDAKLFGLISPHAGYVYSGTCAAFGYKLLKNLNFDTIIIIGPAHSAYIDGASVWSKGGFKTPLGIAQIDEEISNLLISENSRINNSIIPHIEEHSIEVQIPFLQFVLKNNFKIVPIVMGNQTLEYSKIVANSISYILNKFSEKRFLIIASSDLSHYHSSEVAQRLDDAVVDRIRNLDIEGLNEIIEEGKGEACGIGPILVLLFLCKNFNVNIVEILNLTNSGEISGDKTRVVGYLSAAFYKK